MTNFQLFDSACFGIAVIFAASAIVLAASGFPIEGLFCLTVVAIAGIVRRIAKVKGDRNE